MPVGMCRSVTVAVVMFTARDCAAPVRRFIVARDDERLTSAGLSDQVCLRGLAMRSNSLKNRRCSTRVVRREAPKLDGRGLPLVFLPVPAILK